MELDAFRIEQFENILEPNPQYENILYKAEVYKIVSCCFEVHNTLGKGFMEVVYKDALEFEFQKREIPYQRGCSMKIHYKEVILPRTFFADFLVHNKIIIEAKAQNGSLDAHYTQVINYLKASKTRLALLVNFGEDQLVFKRIIL